MEGLARGRGSQLLNRISDVLRRDLASRGGFRSFFHSFLPYLALLCGLKLGKGADLVFGSGLDFHKGVKVGAVRHQIGRHPGAGYQPVHIIAAHPPPVRTICLEVFELLPVELTVPDREQSSADSHE